MPLIIRNGQPGNRVTTGLIVDYTFQEGAGSNVFDVGTGPLYMDLVVSNPGGSSWESDGLDITAINRVDTAGNTAGKIISAAKATNAFTAEHWFTPSSSTQDGPARMSACAPEPGGLTTHNFMVGQGQWQGLGPGQVRSRVRTTAANVDDDGLKNGVALFTADGLLTAGNIAHVVVTFDSATTTHRIWVNGVLVAEDTDWQGDLSNWGESSPIPYQFALANDFGEDDRAWLGTLHRWSFYDRALTQADIEQNFNSGFSGSETPPDPDVTFETAGNTVTEGDGQIAINVLMTRVSQVGDVTIPFQLSGSAVGGGTDYTTDTPSPLVIPQGQVSGQILVTLVDDVIAESTEDLVLTLQQPTNANLGNETTYTVTINDNDSVPDVSWSDASQSVSDTASQATVTLELDRPYSQTVTVDLSVSGTASTPAEYDPPTPDPVVFAPFETSKVVTVSLNTPVAGNTVILDFGTITNGNTGATPTHTITFAAAASIPDLQPGNDGSGFSWPAPPGSGDAFPAAHWTKGNDRELFADGETEFILGLVCGHNQGISQVRFRCNNADDNGLQQTLSETTLDTSTARFTTYTTRANQFYAGTEAYNVRLRAADYPNGKYTVRAHVIPNDGSPAREMEWTFWSNAGGVTTAERWVQNGASGDGLSSSTPTGSIAAAVSSANGAGQAEGLRIFLMSSGQPYTMGSAITTVNNDRPILVRQDPALAAQTVRVRPQGSTQAIRARKMVFEGFHFDAMGRSMWHEDGSGSSPGFRSVTVRNSYCTSQGSYTRTSGVDQNQPINRTMTTYHFCGEPSRRFGSISVAWGITYEDCTLFDQSDGALNFAGHVLHCQQEFLGGSVWRGNACVIGSFAWDGWRVSSRDPEQSGQPVYHPDVFQTIVQIFNGVYSQVESLWVEGQPIFLHNGDQKNLLFQNILMGNRNVGSLPHTLDPNDGPANGDECDNNTWVCGASMYYIGFSIDAANNTFQNNTLVGWHTVSFPGTSVFQRQAHNACIDYAGSLGFVDSGTFASAAQYQDNCVRITDEALAYEDPRNPAWDATPVASSPIESQVPMSDPVVPKYDLYGRLRGASGFTASGPLRGQNEVG